MSVWDVHWQGKHMVGIQSLVTQRKVRYKKMYQEKKANIIKAYTNIEENHPELWDRLLKIEEYPPRK